jgi:hypothetical protein
MGQDKVDARRGEAAAATGQDKVVARHGEAAAATGQVAAAAGRGEVRSFAAVKVPLVATHCTPLPDLVCCSRGPACRCPLRTRSDPLPLPTSFERSLLLRQQEKRIENLIKFGGILYYFELKKILKFGAPLMVAAAG